MVRSGQKVKKFLSFVIPYVMIAMVYLVSMISSDYHNIVLAVLMGIMIGFWFMCARKIEGTKGMLIMLTISFILMILGIVITCLYAFDMTPICVLCSILQLFILVIIYNNKPTISMTYKYNFRNKKRRYF